MAIVVASSDAEDSAAFAMAPPLPASVRAWGKQYMVSGVSPNTWLFMGLQGAPLLRAVWLSMEPEKGPEFCASFEVIFGQPFWPLVMHLEESQGDTQGDSSLEGDHDDVSDDCNTDLDSPGEPVQAQAIGSNELPDFQALFGPGHERSTSCNLPIPPKRMLRRVR